MNIRGQLWIKNGGGVYSKQENIYIDHLNRQIPHFSGGSVLEIGPGSGEFAKRLINQFSITDYTLLDLSENIMDSFNHIKNQTQVIPHLCYAENHKDLFDQHFDLLVSNVCIPETPKEYRESLLNNLVPNTKSAMIIGQLHGPWDEGGTYEEWIKNLFHNTFQVVSCELTTYADCYALCGYNQ